MTYDSTILADSPIAFWPLNDAGGSSTAADATSHGHTLTKAGTVTFGVTGMGDGESAIQVAGAGVLSRTSDSAFDVAQYTYECWFKQTATATVGALIAGVNQGVYLDSAAKAEINDNTHDFKSGGGYADSIWHYLVALFDRTGGTMSLYVDTVYIGAQTLSGGTAGNAVALCQLIPAVGGDNLTGFLAKAAIYSVVLTTTQINAHYTAGGGTPVSPTTVAVNDANLAWSPYAWLVSGGTYAESNSPGAYVKVAFTGRNLRALVDVSILSGVSAGSYPTLRCSVDNGPWRDVQLLAGTSAIVILALGLAAGTHQATIIFLRADNAYDRWTTPVQAVKFTGFLIDVGESTTAPSLQPKRALLYGDSITEGQKILSASIPSGDDATLAYSAFLAAALEAEYGNIAFGGQGWVETGGGNVPDFHNGSGTSTWDKYWNGQSRLSAGSLTPDPDYITVNMGTNDGAASVSAATIESCLSSWLTAVRAAAPLAWIFVIVPFGYWERTGLQNGMADYQAATPDPKAILVDIGQIPGFATVGGTATLYSTDGIHGNQYGQAYAAALLAEAIGAIVGGPSTPAVTVKKTVITTATTTVARAFPALLRAVGCTNGTPAQVTIYDNASAASGQKLYDEVPPAAGMPAALNIPATNGLTVVTTSTATVVLTWS